MADRSSRPRTSPSRLVQRVERRIIEVAGQPSVGTAPDRVHPRLHRSTVGRVLARFRMPLLTHIDQSTGVRVRKAKPVRYELAKPGQLVHVDIKKQERIPDGGGHRMLGQQAGNRNNKKRGRGYAFLHHAVDDHSRLAYP